MLNWRRWWGVTCPAARPARLGGSGGRRAAELAPPLRLQTRRCCHRNVFTVLCSKQCFPSEFFTAKSIIVLAAVSLDCKPSLGGK